MKFGIIICCIMVICYLNMLDVFREYIFGDLKPMDLYNLSCMNKQFNGVISKDVMNKSIIGEINKVFGMLFGDNFDSFKNILYETKSVVSGEFIVGCISGKKILDGSCYKKIKINIYTNNFDMFYIFFGNFVKNIKGLQTQYDIWSKYKYKQYIIGNYCIELRYPRINTISLDDCYEYDNYLDIYKNYYKYENGFDNIVIGHLNDILCKETNFYFNDNFDACLNNYMKYVDLGFIFANIDGKFNFKVKKIKNNYYRAVYKIADCNGIFNTDVLHKNVFDDYKKCHKKCVNGPHIHIKRHTLDFTFVLG